MLPEILANYWRRGGVLKKVDDARVAPEHDEVLLDAEAHRVLADHRDAISTWLAQHPDYFAWRPLGGNARSLWFLYRVAPESAAWHCTAVLSLRGDVTESEFATGLERLCERHPMLRARFGERDGEPCYRIEAAHANEWQHLGEDQDVDAARDRLLIDADRPFALEQGEVMRAGSVRVGDRLIVSLVLHHIVADFYSAEALVRELVGELQGNSIDLPTCDYDQCVRESQAYVESARGAAAVAHWRELLDAAPATLDLPTDFARPTQRSWSGERLERDLDLALCGQVRTLASELKVTPYTVLLGTYLLWLWKLSGQGDFVVGTPTLGRQAARHRNVVGYLANPIAVRARPAAGLPFAALVTQIKAQLDASRRHHRYPLASLIDQFDLPRRSDRAPLFQHFFTYSQARHAWGDALDLDVLHMGMRGAAHELILTVFEDGERLRCQIGYDDALYSRATVLEWLEGYAELLAAVVRDPAVACDAVSWASQAQAGEIGESIDCGPRHAIARMEATPGERVALLEGPQAVTYADLLARARAMAGALQAHGGEVVALASPRGVSQITAMLAAWYAGQGWLALDMRLPPERLAFMLEDSGARLVLGMGERPSWLPDTVTWHTPDSLPAANHRVIAQSPDALAYLIYTSGSTGRPKGVAVTHANLCGYVAGMLERVRPDEDAVFATLATVSADLGHTSLFGSLLGGRSLRLIADELGRDPPLLAEHLERYPIDVLKIVPSHLQALLAAERPERLLPRQMLICGGEALPWAQVERVQALRPQCRIFNHYGPTETTVGATCIDAAHAQPGTASVAIGRPLPGYRAHVLDANGRPVPRGAIGELHVGGVGVARGYWRRDDLTNERFLPDLHDANARMYRTGDRVQRLADGALVFHGRADDQVKIRGFRVEPGEVEQRLRALAGIEQAVVLVHEGASGAQLAAFYCGTHADPLAALRASLPDYLVPSRCVQVESIPVTVNGKVDREALRVLLACVPVEAPATTPLDAFESRLAALWQPLFPGVALTPESSFFALGGDSIGALRLVAQARKAGLPLTPAMLLETPTLRALAERLRPLTTVAPEPQSELAPFALLPREDCERLRRTRPEAMEAYPLSPLQEGLLYNALAAPESGHYVNQQVLRLSGELDRAALAAAWKALLQRHESLRVGFDWEHAERPLQWLRANDAFDWVEHDWSAHDNAWIQRELSLLCERERAAPFALDEPGLLRLHMVSAGASQVWLVLTMHHLIIDRWSAALLLEELVALYRGETLDPAPRYRDYIAWLGAQSSGGEETFWREQLLDYPGGEELPVPARAGSGSYVTEARLEGADAAALRDCAARFQVPLTSLLQAAWAMLLSRYTNTPDVCFGLTVSGRPPALEGGDRIAGLFINTVPMRLCLRAEQSLATLCEQARDASFALQAHDRLPLAQIAAAAGLSGGAALFRSLLVVENIPFDERVTLPGGVTCERLQATSATHLPLLVQVTPEDDALHLLLQSQRAHLDDTFVETVLADWLRLLREFPQRMAMPVGECGLLVLAQWPAWCAMGQGENPPFAGDAMPASLATCVERTIERFPDLPALAGEDRTLSYRALNCAANQLAHHLRAIGVGPGDRVGLVADRSIAITVAVLAVLKAGAAYVPLHPEHPPARIAFVISDAGCRVVLARGAGLECVRDFDGQLLDLDALASGDVLAQQPGTNLPCTHDADSPAYLIYTSGSTGQPKGVVVPHRGPLHLMLAVHAHLPAAPGDRVLQFTGLHFDMSVLEWLCAWTQGACLHLIPREVTRSGEQLLAHLGEQAITHLIAQPAVLAPLDPPPLPALRHVLLAGDVCPDELAARWGRERVFLNAYGPTEASVIVTAERFEAGRPLTIGTPLPHTQCHVLDWSGQPCRAGLVGELHLAGPYLATGYQGLPEKTAAAFRVPTTGPLAGVRLYATGDRVRLHEDGRLEFLGRRDHQVKIRGLRIELGEVEAALREQPGVHEAVALVHRAGSDQACLVAFVQGGVNSAALREALRKRLPSHLLPAHIECMATLPQTPSRKVDRRVLAAQVDKVLRPAAQEPPRTPTEQRLQRVWQRLFQREPIGVTDDFFALGGHSLLATRLAGAIALEFELRLDLRRLFATTTIREQAQLIDALQTAQACTDSAEPVIESGYL